MKKLFLFVVSGFLLTGGLVKAQEVFTSPLDSASYAFGVIMANNLKGNGVEALNYDLVKKAMEATFDGRETMMNAQDASKLYNAWLMEQRAKKYEAGKKEGEDFLAANGKKPGVKTTGSGLQYEVITQGSGPMPTVKDKVKVHYQGTLIDGGLPFDSSYDRGQPATFGLAQVIKGWTEGLQLMQTGSKYKFYIPYNLAYGERGSPPKINPFATLIFEVELLEIVK